MKMSYSTYYKFLIKLFLSTVTMTVNVVPVYVWKRYEDEQ